MTEMGHIVVSTWRETLHQLSLQEGRLIETEIKSPCEHDYLYLLCVQVACVEYLAVSCNYCKNIKLMDLNKQKINSSELKLIQYEVMTVFNGKKVGRMCHGEEKRIFVQSNKDTVLELNTSTTTFTIVKAIKTGSFLSLCYVPDPHQLLVVSDLNGVRAVSCDDNTDMWVVQEDDNLDPGRLLYIPSHNAILVADWEKNKAVVLNAGNGSLIHTIPLLDDVRNIQGLCMVSGQIVVASEGMGEGNRRILYFSLN